MAMGNLYFNVSALTPKFSRLADAILVAANQVRLGLFFSSFVTGVFAQLQRRY